MKMTFLSRLRRPRIGPFATVIVFVLVLLRWPASMSSGQDSPGAVTVTGTVRTSEGEPVAGASVSLEERNSAKPIETKTSADGAFAVFLDHGGAYTVRAQKTGLGGGSKELV